MKAVSRPTHSFAFLAPLAITVATVMITFGMTAAQAQDQTVAPEWYDQEKVDAWGRNLVALLNAGKIEEASQFVPFDGMFEVAIVDLVREKKDDPEVLAYLKEFYSIFKSVVTPKGKRDGTTDFLQSGTEGDMAYVLLRVLPKNKPKAPELQYLQISIAPMNDSYGVEDVFSLRADKSLNTVCRTLFLGMMPESVFEKIETWSDEHKSIHAERANIMAVLEQCRLSDPSCIDSFLALDPPRPHDLVLLEACSGVVFENTDDPDQIKKVMKAWQVARPQGFCNLIWNACGMRRLGGDGWAEANKIFDVMQKYPLFQNDAYLDVLSADHSMRLQQPADAEAHAIAAVQKEPNLFIARHVLHLILAKKDDFASIAKSLSELAQLDQAFTLKYIADTEQLARFRESDEGKALLAELQK
jgi:hypothetical protein